MHSGIRTSIGCDGKLIVLDATGGAKLGKKMRDHLEKVYEIEATPILHLIGGELTLLHGISDFILEASSQYELVIMTTNGLLLDHSIIKLLSSCKNLLILFSLDGNTFDMNSYRVPTSELSNRLLKNLDACLDAGIKIEVQTVLHNRNISKIKGFSDYLLSYANSGHYIKLIPFPVRWTQGKIVLSNCDLSALNQIYEQYQYYQRILPPKIYMSNLLAFLNKGKRTTRCYVPYFVFGVDDRGRIKNCPCIPSMCSSINFETDTVRSDIVNERETYKNKKVCSGLCNTCFEGWEIYNAYLQDNVSEDELRQMAVGQLKSSFEVLDRIKEKIIVTDSFAHINI
jgi:MoaA/NifB/PqqE/SkfB family radical SAM enzyme